MQRLPSRAGGGLGRKERKRGERRRQGLAGLADRDLAAFGPVRSMTSTTGLLGLHSTPSVSVGREAMTLVTRVDGKLLQVCD